MPIQMVDTVNFNGIPSMLFTLPTYVSDPAFNVADEGQFIYNTTANQVKFNDGTRWVTLGESGAGGPPTGAAGGDLTGSYPNPTIRDGAVTDAAVSAVDSSKVTGLAAALAGKVDTSGGTMTGALTLPGDPAAPLQAATKQYVDLLAQGFIIKDAVRVVATDNITLTGWQTIDGVLCGDDDVVLVAGQTDQRLNGVYWVSSGPWSRTQDSDSSGEIRDGTIIPIQEGTAHADSLWICTATSSNPWMPGASTSSWTKFLTLSDLQAGNGLTKTGATIDFVAADSSLTVGPDSVAVAHAPRWTTPRTLTLLGDASGSAVIDGSGDVSLDVVLQAGSGSYAADVGAGTAVTVIHNLGTRDVTVEVYRNSTPWDTVYCAVERTTSNSVTLRFASAVSAGQYRCVVTG